MQDLSSRAFSMLAIITDKVAQSVEQGKALLEISAQIVHTNLRIFQIIHDIQLFIIRMPGQIQRQQPVYLIDPYNKESPFHLEFVRSPEALLAILRINLKESGCGPAMIDRGEFAIEELGTQRPIDLKAPWQVCFFPGQRVAMSMVFKQQQTDVESSCPTCGTNHPDSTGRDITCNVCGAIFRRIKEVIEEIPETSESSDDCSDEVSKDVAGRLVNGPARPPQDKREEDSLSADVRKFRRIQLINTSIALSLAHMPSPRYPNTDDRVVREVGFMRDPVTAVSRPLNTEESWAAYYFETHARQCRYCHEPYEVYRNDEQLCESGHGLAQDVGAFLYTRAGEIFSTCEEGDKLVQVELPMGYVQVRNLLKAIEYSLRSEHAVQQFISFDRTQ